jgi:hypothetical protein
MEYEFPITCRNWLDVNTKDSSRLLLWSASFPTSDQVMMTRFVPLGRSHHHGQAAQGDGALWPRAGSHNGTSVNSRVDTYSSSKRLPATQLFSPTAVRWSPPLTTAQYTVDGEVQEEVAVLGACAANECLGRCGTGCAAHPDQTGPRPPILWRGVKATVPWMHQYDERPFYPKGGRGLRRAVIEALICQDLHGSDTVALTPH